MKAVICKITQGEESAEIWSAPRAWSSVREGLRLVPVDQAIEEFTKEAAKVLGENVRIAAIETGSTKTRTIVATL